EHGVLDAAVAGEDDDRDRQAALLHFLDELNAIQPGQLEVGEANTILPLSATEQFERFRAVAGAIDGDALLLAEQLLQLLTELGVVLGDQDAPYRVQSCSIPQNRLLDHCGPRVGFAQQSTHWESSLLTLKPRCSAYPYSS